MGKFSGKVLTVYITPSGVRVAEGENRNGTPTLQRFFVVQGVSEFFTSSAMSLGVSEITNMAGLVDAIVQECNAQRVGTRRVMVCSNCFGIRTEVVNEQQKSSLKNVLTGDLSALKLGGSKGSPVGPGFMMCRVPWGDIVRDGVVEKKVTETTGEKYILLSLVREFYTRGYEVLSISDNVGALLNLWQTEYANFDSQGKIIFDFDSRVRFIAMCKDIPIEVRNEDPRGGAELLLHIENYVQSCSEQTGRNPKIYLAGEMMRDTSLYNELIERLEGSGYVVYDMFNRPVADPVTGMSLDGNTQVLTADYYVNIAMLLASYSKNIVSLVPTLDFSEVFRKNSKAITRIVLGAAVLAFVVSSVFGVMRVLELKEIQENPTSVASLESQIQALQMNQQSLQSTIETLTQADVTVIDVINFAYNNQSSQVTLVSVDTQDMLGPAYVPVTDGVTETPDGEYQIGYTGGSTKARMAIILRGFAKTGPAAVDYFDKLFHIGLATDPIMRGVQRYELPNGEAIYAFEIQIGG